MFIFPGPQSLGFQTKFSGTTDATVNNVTTENSIIPTGSGTMTIPAAWMKVGNTARLVMRGLCTTPLVAGNATFKVKLNGNMIASGTVGSLLGSVTNGGISLSETITIRSTGTTGTAVVAGSVKYPSGALTTKGEADLTSTSPITLDTTVDQVVTVTVQFGLGSHIIKMLTCTLELLEPSS